MFKEASIYTLKRLSEQERMAYGLRVLVMRRWPRGVARQDIDLWIPSAAPLPDLLDAYRDRRILWVDVAEGYRVNQAAIHVSQVYDYRGKGAPRFSRASQGTLAFLRSLEREHGTITLLCWEQEGPCHRFVLKELLEQEGGMR